MNNTTQIDIPESLKDAMRNLPAGVSILTARDRETNAQAGMVVSSVLSVSMSPPTMLVSINRSSSCHGVISRAGQFCINLLGESDSDLVGIFASGARRHERFTQTNWRVNNGLDYLTSATALFCKTSKTIEIGTHDIFIGEVFNVIQANSQQPLAWMRGNLHRVVPV
jgi:flavin reductase (DIM6/NTAB) family NADH-FMN oxidoreductase RutF